MVAKFGDSAMLADGLAGGMIGCAPETGAGAGAGEGFGFGFGAGRGAGRDGAAGAAVVGVARGVVVTGTGAVVVGSTAWGWRKAMGGPDCPGPGTTRAVVRAGAGSNAVRTTRVRATRVTVPTRADVPPRGRRRSTTRRRVSELDTSWLSASSATR
jgi:hypothetical protein